MWVGEGCSTVHANKERNFVLNEARMDTLTEGLRIGAIQHDCFLWREQIFKLQQYLFPTYEETRAYY